MLKQQWPDVDPSNTAAVGHNDGISKNAGCVE
jgi:hypothetical protein